MLLQQRALNKYHSGGLWTNACCSHPYFNQETLAAAAKRLQEEILKNKNLLGVYAYDKNFIRLYNDKMIFSFEEDEARYNERTLTKDTPESARHYLFRSLLRRLSLGL